MIAVLTVLVGAGLGVALQRLGPPPLHAASPVSTLVLDRNGKLLRPFTTPEGRWRLPVSVSEVDPTYIEILIAYEDKRFYRHWGVDPWALIRALWQAASRGRIVSGASTLTMQVARLLEPREVRSLGAKLREMLRAVQIEAHLSKREILALYLRLAPFGGNLEGVRAASLTYFGKEPKRLAPHEAALLVALPQSPETRRPDRFVSTARNARNRVLARASAADLLSASQIQAYAMRDLPTRRHSFPRLAAHVAQTRIAHAPEKAVHKLTLDREIQAVMERLATDGARKIGAKHSAAIVVIENKTGAVLAHVGSAGFFDHARAGQIDMALAMRSPGSALKPFIYGLAFERGLAHPETLIEDRPARFGGYAPRNFDQEFQGTVTVREALQLSLNIPAVQALEAVGPARLLARLRSAGAAVQLPSEDAPGLAIALGGIGITLMDLAKLYAALARQGEPTPLHETLSPHAISALAVEPGAKRLLSPAAAWYVGDILRNTPPPVSAAGGAIAFKTGTSYGYRDAWAAGFDRQFTIAVWMGRPDGASSPGLTGISAAAPILHDAFARLGQKHTPLAPAPPDAIHASTAQLPLPLRHFRGGKETGQMGGPKIAFPPNGARVELTNANKEVEPLALKAEGGALPLTWFVNGRPLPQGVQRRMAFWQPDGEGFAELTVMDSQGHSDHSAFRVELRR